MAECHHNCSFLDPSETLTLPPYCGEVSWTSRLLSQRTSQSCTRLTRGSTLRVTSSIITSNQNCAHTNGEKTTADLPLSLDGKISTCLKTATECNVHFTSSTALNHTILKGSHGDHGSHERQRVKSQYVCTRPNMASRNNSSAYYKEFCA